MRTPKANFNMKIPHELFNALTEYINQYKSAGIRKTKVFVVEQLLFRELRKRGFLDNDYIKKAEEYYG
jgi:hypothetical protein